MQKVLARIKNNSDFIFIAVFVNLLHVFYYSLLGNFTDVTLNYDTNLIARFVGVTYNYSAPVLNAYVIGLLTTVFFGIPFFLILRIVLVTLFVYAYLVLLKNLNISKKIAFFSCLLIVSLPDFYIISQFWVYEIFFFFFATFTVSAFSNFVKKESTGSLFLFFCSLAVLGSFRTFYGLLFFIITLAFLFYFYPIKLYWRKIVIAALIPFSLILFGPVKNYIYYGVFSANTTYDGMPLSTFFEFQLNRDTRINGVETGKLPEIVLCVPGPWLGDYPVYAKGKKYDADICHKEIIPQLAKNFIKEKNISQEVVTKTGSMNDIAYWYELRKADIQVLKYYPNAYWDSYSEALRLYFKPSFPYILLYLSNYRDVLPHPEGYSRVKWLFRLSDIALHPHVAFSHYHEISSYYRMIFYPFVLVSLLILLLTQTGHRKIYIYYFALLFLLVLFDLKHFYKEWTNWSMEYKLMRHLIRFNLAWAILLSGMWIKNKWKGVVHLFNKEKIILSYILLFITYTSAAILLGSAVDQNKNRQPIDAIYFAAFVYVVSQLSSKQKHSPRVT